ncbi:hypothetical protein K0U07_03235 [bacterium]|nr:hypothetical protein [bacterium]
MQNLKSKQTMYLIATVLLVPLSFLLIGRGEIAPSAHMTLFLVSLAGALNSFVSRRVDRIMRYVPLKGVLTFALCYQTFETWYSRYLAGTPLIAADYFPLTVIVAYLFSSRISRLIRKAAGVQVSASTKNTDTHQN